MASGSHWARPRAARRLFTGMGVAAFWALAAGAPAGAKVVFTGYGDLRAVPASQAKIGGEPAALAFFGLTDRKIDAHNFQVASVGLFASTTFGEKFSFDADLTYRNLRFTATDIRTQYAFLEYEHSETLRFRAGKITLPFGYYNEHHFYPFQRESISNPIFQGGILGLPIADIGADVRKTFVTDAFRLNLALYGVNGYGNVTGAAGSLRQPSALGLVLANSLTATNNNEEISFGGQIELEEILGRHLRAGISAYTGPWDPNGRNNFTMANAHIGYEVGRLRLEAEGLWMEANGDQGFHQALGVTDWRTTGFFVEGTYHLMDFREMPVHVFGRFEQTRTEPDAGGSIAREYLRGINAGASLRVNENLTLKGEVADIDYDIPVRSSGILILDARSATIGAAVSF